VRRELELALLVVSSALAAYGVNAALRLATDDMLPAAPITVAAPAVSEPLDPWAPIAARDIFNGTRTRTGGDAMRRLVGVGFQAGEARAAIEDLRTHRQELVGVGDAVGDARVTSIAEDASSSGLAARRCSPLAAAETPPTRRRSPRPPAYRRAESDHPPDLTPACRRSARARGCRRRHERPPDTAPRGRRGATAAPPASASSR
jgi:hypothetical protein